MQSPERMAVMILGGEAPAMDCEESAVLMASMMQSVGVPASVAFLDTNGDGQIDHAMTTVLLNGQVVYAETTIPGKDLGWKPQTSRVETIPFRV